MTLIVTSLLRMRIYVRQLILLFIIECGTLEIWLLQYDRALLTKTCMSCINERYPGLTSDHIQRHFVSHVRLGGHIVIVVMFPFVCLNREMYVRSISRNKNIPHYNRLL